MKSYKVTIEILSYWHAGSGHGTKGDLDATVLRDSRDLPYLPGRTLKGLLREGMRHSALQNEVETDLLFGRAAEDKDPAGSSPGSLRFTDARLPENLAKSLASDPAIGAQLYDSVSATALDEGGQAKDGSLRVSEVAVPVTLEATVTQTDEKEVLSTLREAASFVRALGSHRHRGLGRCRIQVEPAN